MVNSRNRKWFHSGCRGSRVDIFFSFVQISRNSRKCVKFWHVNLWRTTVYWIEYLFRKFTMNTLSVLRIYYEFTIVSANSLWVHFLFRDFTIFFASKLQMKFLFHKFTINSLYFSQIHYEFTLFRKFWVLDKTAKKNIKFDRTVFLNLIQFSGHVWMPVLDASSSWIQYLFREFIMNSLSYSRSHY